MGIQRNFVFFGGSLVGILWFFCGRLVEVCWEGSGNSVGRARKGEFEWECGAQQKNNVLH